MDKRKWCQPLLLTSLGLIITAALIYGVVWLASLFSGPIALYILVLSIAGGFGGLCYSLIENKGLILCHLRFYKSEEPEKPGGETGPENKVKPAKGTEKPEDKKPGLDLGCVADIWVGMGSAFAIFFVLSGLITLTKDVKAIEPATIFVLAGMGVVAGAGGKGIFPLLIDKMKDMITKKIAEEAKKTATEAQDKAEQAEAKAAQDHQKSLSEISILVGNTSLNTDWDSAGIAYENALKANPDSVRALVGLAMVRKRQDKLLEAIEFCTQAINKDPEYALAYYNRACYKSRANKPLPEVLADLNQAIALDESWRQSAKSDKDFDPVRGQPEFQEIINKSQ